MRKGFTLVELIATIVILAIVAVIGSYFILNVIEDSKSKNRIIMASKVASTMESYAINQELEKGTAFINQSLVISNKNVSGIDFSLNGTLTDEGLITIDANGVIVVYLYDGKYCTHGTKDNLVSTLGECDYSDNFVILFSTSKSLSVDKQTLTLSITDITSSTDLNAFPYSFDGGATWQAENSYLTTNNYQNEMCVKNINNKFVCSFYTIYKLNISANGGILTNMSEEDLFWLEENESLTISNPSRIGYTYVDWTVSGTNSSISGTTFTMGTGDASLSANWSINSYTLTVNANGGSWSGTTPQILEYNSTTTINNPTRTGYTFNGWSISGTNSSISGTTFTMGSIDATITANWVVNTYTLTVNANGGSWSGTTPQNVNYSASVTVANPTRTNYTFTGWTVSGTGSSISGTTFTMGTANATLTANWTINTYTLTVNANGGSWSGTTPQTIAVGGTATISNPTRSGHVFINWTVSGTGASLSGTTFTMGTANATLTANWYTYANMYTYTGSSTVIDDGSGNWRIRFLTSGTFTPKVDLNIDVFLVGGGANGNAWNTTTGAGGGGGGYTRTQTNRNVTANTGYAIVIGAGGGMSGGRGLAGGSTSGFGYTANGGQPGPDGWGGIGGAGGSGGGGHAAGLGGSNGSNGQNMGRVGGVGQGTTTREFGGTSGTIYSYGGNAYNNRTSNGTGGLGATNDVNATAGAANSGSGGGGGYATRSAGGGGSGIVIIRNKR